jgi:hypothetical protein
MVHGQLRGDLFDPPRNPEASIDKTSNLDVHAAFTVGIESIEYSPQTLQGRDHTLAFTRDERFIVSVE